MPARSSGPPKAQGGPLSYLSTVTTASTSDWGSQSLDYLSKQPSDVASASYANPGASTSAAGARAASSIATSSGQRGGGNGSGDSRQELGRKVSSADQSSADQGRASSRSSRASAEASETVGVSNISRARRADPYSKPLPTASEAQVRSEGSDSAAMPSDGRQQMPSVEPSDSQSQRQGPYAENDTTSNTAAAAADWSAFGGAATRQDDSHQPQHATTSQAASAQQSGHAFPAPSTSRVSAAQHEWSAFGEPSSASFDAAPSGMDGSAKEAAEEGAGFDNSNPFLGPGQFPTKQSVQAGMDFASTNPFLEPGQDPWQRDTQAAPADLAEAARMASGDSFGDFNAPGEREDDFEVAAWDAAALPEDKTDRTAAVACADPFAASANFTDFAALLEPAQTDLLGGLDTVARVKALPQGPSLDQFGLSELQGDVDLGLQQGAQSSEQLQGQILATQVSGVFFDCLDAATTHSLCRFAKHAQILVS